MLTLECEPPTMLPYDHSVSYGQFLLVCNSEPYGTLITRMTVYHKAVTTICTTRHYEHVYHTDHNV